MCCVSRTQPESLLSQAGREGTTKARHIGVSEYGRQPSAPRDDGRGFIWNLREALCSVSKAAAVCRVACQGDALMLMGGSWGMLQKCVWGTPGGCIPKCPAAATQEQQQRSAWGPYSRLLEHSRHCSNLTSTVSD